MLWKPALSLVFSLLLPLTGWGQSFKKLEKALENPPAVKELILKRDRLNEVPPKIAQFENLEVLDLSFNDIQTLPVFLAELPRLHTLVLSKNELSHFPEFLKESPNLEILILDRNPIDSIPIEIARFQKLKHLDLWDSQVGYVDEAVLTLKTLQYLDLRNTYFRTKDLLWIKEGMPWLDLKTSFGCNCD